MRTLGIVLLWAVSGLFLSSRVERLKRSEAFRRAASTVQADSTIANAVGTPLTFGGFPTGVADDDDDRAALELLARGPRGELVVSVEHQRWNDQWRLVRLAYVDERGVARTLAADDEERIRRGSDHIRAGRALVGQQRYDEAIAELEQAVAEDPGSSRAHYWRGVAYGDRGQPGRAILDYEQAVQLNPYDPYAHAKYGVALARSGDPTGAIEQLTRVIALDPENLDGYYFRAMAESLRGDHAGALRDTEKGCSLGDERSCRAAEWERRQ